MTAVATWPSYLLRGVPQQTRLHMSDRALRDDVSLADVVRQALCNHYDLDCDPASYRYQPDLDTGNNVLLIRFQPDVWKLMRKETRARYGEFRRLILQSLDDYLEAP